MGQASEVCHPSHRLAERMATCASLSISNLHKALKKYGRCNLIFQPACGYQLVVEFVDDGWFKIPQSAQTQNETWSWLAPFGNRIHINETQLDISGGD